MAKPSTFTIAVYPVHSIGGGLVSIDIMNCLKRVVVEATLETIRAKMQDIGQEVGKDAGKNEVHVACYPDTSKRAPNGFKEFQAARKNQMTLTIGMHVATIANSGAAAV